MHSIHDFAGKLRQPAVFEQVQGYVEWRRRLADARKRGEPDPEPPKIAPLSINLDLTTACNYRCTHCIDWDILNTKHKHQYEELCDAMALMRDRGMRSVILIGGGEPTLHPNFVEFVKYLKDLGLQVAVVTNGSRGQELLDAAAYMDERDWIRLSLDSGSNDLFVRMHRPVQKKVDLDAICEWIPRIKDANPAVRVGFSYIIVWAGATRDDEKIHENIDEIVMAAERAREARFDYIAFKPVLERQPDGAEIMDPQKAEQELRSVISTIRREVDRAKQLQTEAFSVYESINLRLLEEESWDDFTRQPKTCHMQALRQVLTPTGLYNCPAHRGVAKAKLAGPEAYRDAQAASKTGGELLRILDDFDASHECREVTCLYHSVNWWLEELIDSRDEDLRSLIGDELQDYFL